MRPTDELHSDNHKRKAQKAKLAQQRLHLTAFGAGMRTAIPLQCIAFADDPSAIIGGR